MEKVIYDVKSDPDYKDAYIDLKEMRVRVLEDGTQIPYHYVHGGFKKKGVKFSFCFPEKEQYKGRFFHYLSPFPGPDEEVASLTREGADDHIAFSLVNGAYFVESNMGSTAMFGATGDAQLVWKSSAAVAEYSREVAMELYGCSRPFGYVYGGSGGGYKTMACIENTNAWDGACPFVIGSPVSLPNSISLHAQGQRTLRHAFPKIIDALDAGGSGDMYAGLTEDEQAMLKEVTLMGFPPKAWFFEAEGHVDDGSLPVLTPGVKMSDPSFFEDFWKVVGYAGADPKSNAVRDRLVFHGVVKAVHVPGTDVSTETGDEIDGRNGVDTAWQKMLTDGKDAWIELEDVPTGEDLYLKGVNIRFETGAAQGKQLLLGDIKDHCLIIGMCYGMDDLAEVLSSVKPGDQVVLDNSDYIAIQHYYRHQVPADTNFHAWDQFRKEDGSPAIPQRAVEMGYGFTGTGTVQDGNLQGKVILTQSLMDESTFPWCGDWYRNTVRKTMGNEDSFRIHYMENCIHGEAPSMHSNRITTYVGALYQALLDVSDWVERGKEPLPSSCYTCNGGQIIPAESARERKGIQQTVTLLANGSDCAHVRVGEPVHFTMEALVPEGAGRITAAGFDFKDHVIFQPIEEPMYSTAGTITEIVKDGLYGATSEADHTYDAPGTYFASVLVQMNRDGNAAELFTQVKNLARVRVVVTE